MNATAPATAFIPKRIKKKTNSNSNNITKSRSIMMWTLGFSLSSILLLVLTGNLSVAIARSETEDQIDRVTKTLRKVTSKPGKLIDAKNVNRGAEGTVTKDMNRGPPLKGNLPEDSYDDDEMDDDEYYVDDEERPYEEKQLEEKKKKHRLRMEMEAEKLEVDKAKSDKLEVEVEVENAKADKGSNAMWDAVAEEEEDDSKDSEDTSEDESENENAETETPDKAEPEKATTEVKKERVTKKLQPRVWESNANAVMKIIDSDAKQDFEIDEDGKLIVEESEDSSDDSSDDEEEEVKVPDLSTYIPLPNLATLSADDAAHQLLSTDSLSLIHPLQERLSSMFTKATSHECRAKIAEHMALFVNGFAEETKFPFEDFYYPNTCKAIDRHADWDNLPEGVNLRDVSSRVYQPKKEDVPEGTYLENVEELQLLYVILTHDAPESTIRLMESVYVAGVTKYVIHVDGKEKSDDTYKALVEYAKEKNEQAAEDGAEEYIRIVPTENRVRVNWGGYSMVEATLVALRTVFGLDYDYESHPDDPARDDYSIDNPHAFQFHKLIHIASTTYPLASNTEIRDTLSSYPLDANFLHIILRPNNPTPAVWNYFVECDDALHRIYRLPALNFDRGNGVDIYTSSQWFIISREFAWYLASPPKGSFVEYYLEYVEHVVVADEAFFGTVLRNTHFCDTLHNDNFLHLQFDRWENEATGARDQRKCVMKNRNHCGRSPTTLTPDYLPALELSGDLFARKFDDEVEPHIKDYIDKRRLKEEERFRREAELIKEANEKKAEGDNTTKSVAELPLEEWEFQGEGVMIVAKETVNDKVPLCMGLGQDSNKVLLQPCFKDDVPESLSPQWEAGAVIIEEVQGLNRWDIGPCSSDGELQRNATGELEMIPGEYSDRGPSCGIKIGDGPRVGRCIDTDSEKTTPGGELLVYPCYTRWHQLFSFGNGTIAPRGAFHTSLPLHMARELKKKAEKEQAALPMRTSRAIKEEIGQVHQHLCVGVVGRGNMTEHWMQWTEEELEEYDPWELPDADRYPNGRKNLQLWSGEQLQTTPCSNEGGVIEWYFVPFIVEEYDDEEEGKNTEEEDGAEAGEAAGSSMMDPEEEL